MPLKRVSQDVASSSKLKALQAEMSMFVITLADWVRDAICITSTKARHVVHAVVKLELAIV